MIEPKFLITAVCVLRVMPTLSGNEIARLAKQKVSDIVDEVWIDFLALVCGKPAQIRFATTYLSDTIRPEENITL